MVCHIALAMSSIFLPNAHFFYSKTGIILVATASACSFAFDFLPLRTMKVDELTKAAKVLRMARVVLQQIKNKDT